MKQQIIESINDAEKLEHLYRQDQREFENCFREISGDYDTPLVRFWTIRLTPDRKEVLAGTQLRDLFEMLALALCTAILAIIPALFTGVGQDFFYLRNLPLIAFNGLILYSLWLSKSYGPKNLLLYGSLLVATTLYINLLPAGETDTILIAALHIPLMLWCFFGLAWLQFNHRTWPGRMDFIRFSGELVIMTGLILLAGGVLTVITQGLFTVIGINIIKFYTGFIAVPGAAAAPVIAWYLIRTYPGITSRIAPVIARVFTPVVLITLTVYLVISLFSESSILENREMLIIFNVMLLGVLALIIFSVSGINKEVSGKNNLLVLLLLSVVAIIINSIALAVIVTRITEGITPNRTVVLITNILVFINLILMAVQLYRSRFRGAPVDAIEKSVAGYLTVYAAWTVIAIFVLPALFGFR